jgi:hypothetical protein
VDKRFPYSRLAILGPSKFAVVVNAHLGVEFPLLRAPLVVPWPQVAGCVRIVEVERLESAGRPRRPRVLCFGSSKLKNSNVAIVFRPRLRMPQFTIGAEYGFPISRSERRQGLDLDVLGVNVADPDGLVARLVGRGVPRFETITEALNSP